MSLDIKTIKDTRELVKTGCSIGGNLAIEILDFVIQRLEAEQKPIHPIIPKSTSKHKDAFFKRFAQDNCDNMTEEEWGAWVDRLPREEFIAMLLLGKEDGNAKG